MTSFVRGLHVSAEFKKYIKKRHIKGLHSSSVHEEEATVMLEVMMYAFWRWKLLWQLARMSLCCPCHWKSYCDPFSCQSSWAPLLHRQTLLIHHYTEPSTTNLDKWPLLCFHTEVLLGFKLKLFFFLNSLLTFLAQDPHLLCFHRSGLNYVNIQALPAAAAVSLRCRTIVTHQTVQSL